MLNGAIARRRSQRGWLDGEKLAVKARMVGGGGFDIGAPQDNGSSGTLIAFSHGQKDNALSGLMPQQQEEESGRRGGFGDTDAKGLHISGI